MVVLLKGKSLIVTKPSKLFKYETGVDSIRIYIPQTYNDIDFSDLNCVVELDRPYYDGDSTTVSTSLADDDDEDENATSKDYKGEAEAEGIDSSADDDDTTHTYTADDGTVREKLFKYFRYDEEIYKDGFLSITIPVTTALTILDGTITFWLIFLKPNDDTTAYAQYVFVTDSITFTVNPNDSLSCDGADSFDEVWEHSNIDAIVHKINNLITFEEENNSVVDFEDDEEESESNTDGGTD